MKIYHPRCLSGKNCVIAVDGGGCFLSRLHPYPYCIRCSEAKALARQKLRETGAKT